MSKPIEDPRSAGEALENDVDATGDNGASTEELMERIRMLHARNTDLAQAVAAAQTQRRRRLH